MTYNIQPIPINQSYTHKNYCLENACMNPYACSIRVEGQGSVKVQPDIATVIVGVTTENEQLKAAQDENSLKINRILNALREMGISSNDIQTQTYFISPQYDYIDGKQVFRSYMVMHELKIIIRYMNRVGEVIDTAVRNGANQVSSISFAVEDTSVYYRQALAYAVDDVMAKARTLGQKLKIDISNVPVQIIEEGYQRGITAEPYLFQRSEAPTQIQTGQTEITARIDAMFSYTK